MAKHSGDIVFRERPETIVASPPHQTSSGLFFSPSVAKLSPLSFEDHRKNEKVAETKETLETPPLSPQTWKKKLNLPDPNQPTNVSSPAPPTLQKRKAAFNFTPRKDYARVSENPPYVKSQLIASVSPTQQEIATPQRVQIPHLQSPVHRSSTPRTPLAGLDTNLTKNLFLGSPNSPTFTEKLHAEVRKPSSILMIGPESPTFSLLPPAISTPDSPDSLFVTIPKSVIPEDVEVPSGQFQGLAVSPIQQEIASSQRIQTSLLQSPIHRSSTPRTPLADIDSHLTKNLFLGSPNSPTFADKLYGEVRKPSPILMIGPESPTFSLLPPAISSTDSPDSLFVTIPKSVVPEDVEVPSGQFQGLAAIGKVGLAFFLVTAAVLSSENRVFLPSAVWEEAHVASIRGILRKSEIPQHMSLASTGLKALWTPFDPKRDVGGPDWRWCGVGLSHHLRPALRFSKEFIQILRAGFSDSSTQSMATDQGGHMTGSSKHSSQAVRDAAQGVPSEDTSLYDPQSGLNSQQQDADKRADALSSDSQDSRAFSIQNVSGKDTCGDETRGLVPDISGPNFHSEVGAVVQKEVDMSEEQKGDTMVDGALQSVSKESDNGASSVLVSEFQTLQSEELVVNMSPPADMAFPESEAEGALVGKVTMGAESMADFAAYFDTWEPQADGRDAVSEEDQQQAVEHMFPSMQGLAARALAIALTLLLSLSGLLFLVLRMTEGKRGFHAGTHETQSEGEVTSVPDSRETMHRQDSGAGEEPLVWTPVRNGSGSSHAEEIEMTGEAAEYGSFEAYKRAINATGNVVVTPVRRSVRIRKGQAEASPAGR